MKIDKDTYKTHKYYRQKHDKTQIILGGSLRKDNLHIKRFETKDGGKAKEGSTFSIDREGNIFQHFDPKYYSDFMDDKDIDRKSISIILENMGMLFYDFESGKYLNWIHDECPDELKYERKWNGHTYWEHYSREQYNSTVNLCKFLINEFDIELDCLGFNVYYEDTLKYEGIVTRSNYNSDYSDLNPSFDFKEFLEDLEIEI
jgi:hypothetical protein